MSKEKSPAKSSGQTKAPSIKSDRHPVFPAINTKGSNLYATHGSSDGSKPNLGGKKKS
jgi:hypothetical protein